MIIDLDAVPGCVTVRGPDEVLRTANDVGLPPGLAGSCELDGEGVHMVIATSLGAPSGAGARPAVSALVWRPQWRLV